MSINDIHINDTLSKIYNVLSNQLHFAISSEKIYFVLRTF